MKIVVIVTPEFQKEYEIDSVLVYDDMLYLRNNKITKSEPFAQFSMKNIIGYEIIKGK